MNDDCMTCFEHISEYLDGELDRELCETIRAHCEACAECARCIESLERSIELCTRAARDSLPPETKERMKAAIRRCLDDVSG